MIDINKIIEETNEEAEGDSELLALKLGLFNKILEA